MTLKNKLLSGGILIALIVLFLIFEVNGIFTKNTKKSFNIENGMGFYEISEGLSDNDFINSAFGFKVYAKIFHSKKLDKIKTGTIEANGRMSYKEVINLLENGKRDNGDIRITIPEGYELREIADVLEKNGLINREKFYDVIKNYDFDYDFIKNIEKSDNRLEGFLFPDTYIFSKNIDDEVSIIKKMLNRFDEIYSKYENEEDKWGYSTYEVITLASIIEREGACTDDFKKVSSVFHNRLKRKDHLGYLQSCATVQYILKERKKVLSVSDTAIDSPYNTYKYKGLPKGPISSPGEEAIKAALNPLDTNYYYFLNDKDGNLHFSNTLDEHNNKKIKYVN